MASTDPQRRTILVSEALIPLCTGPRYRLKRSVDSPTLIPWRQSIETAQMSIRWHTPVLVRRGKEILVTTLDTTGDQPRVYGVEVEAIPGTWVVIGNEMPDSRADRSTRLKATAATLGGVAVEGPSIKVSARKKPGPTVKLLLLQVKSEQFNVMANRLKMPAQLREDYFDHGEYADLELWVTPDMQITRARFIPRG